MWTWTLEAMKMMDHTSTACPLPLLLILHLKLMELLLQRLAMREGEQFGIRSGFPFVDQTLIPCMLDINTHIQHVSFCAIGGPRKRSSSPWEDLARSTRPETQLGLGN